MAKLTQQQITKVRAAAAREAKENALESAASAGAEAEHHALAYKLFRESRAKKDTQKERLTWGEALAQAAAQIKNDNGTASAVQTATDNQPSNPQQ